MHGARPLKLKERNETQPSLILLYAPVLLRPWRIKMSWQQKAQCPWSNSGLFLSSVWLAGENRVKRTEGLFVLPTSYESWFWLVEVPAHISPLWREDRSGTDPPTLHKHPPPPTQPEWCQAECQLPPGSE